MVLRGDGDAVIAIGQASHAWLSGQIARGWGGPVAGDLEHREAVCLAAEQHDVGMAQWDLAPELDPGTGRPRGFMDMSLDTHLDLWSRAPQRLFTQSRLAALLVSLHGTRLYERRDLARLPPGQADDVRAYLAGQRALQERLAGDTGVPWPVLTRLQSLLFAWDWLSLGLCLRWAPAELAGVPAAAGAEMTIALRADTVVPWPFAAERVELVCEGRRLVERASSEAELHARLERAPRVELRFALTRAPSGAP